MPEALGYQPEQYQQKPREVVASRGFSVEYAPNTSEAELRDDITSYLAEYRFRVGKFDYPLVFTQDHEGSTIRDVRRGESMLVKAKRSIREKRMREENSAREEAEAQGISILSIQLSNASEGDSMLWFSPPGKREEGYGDYGFAFLGRVRRTIQVEGEIRKDIEMSAIRLEKPEMSDFNNAFEFLIGRGLNAQKPEEFLRNPVVLANSYTKDQLEAQIRRRFIVKGGREEIEWAGGAIVQLDPAINEFIRLTKFGTREEKLDAFYSLEKHAVQLDKWRREGVTIEPSSRPTLDQLRFVYKDVELETVAGSCPIANKSGNIFESSYNALNNAINEWFNCPSCNYKADGPVGNTCPNCGLTKEKYAETADVVC